MLLNGKAPRPGQLIKLPNLAKTFRTIAEEGKDGFYKGRIAEAIVELIQSGGGVMSLEDLAKHESTVVEPISYKFNDEVTIYEVCITVFAEGIIESIYEHIVPSEWSRYFSLTDPWLWMF